MAKKQSFGDKVARKKAETKRMAMVIVSAKKDNGHFCFTQKMVDQAAVQDELKAAKAS